ncbi:MAG: hypothetical protein ACRD4R_01285 [Candidatus Acidiferrales bacterium]
MANYVKAIIYTAVFVWAIVLLVTGQTLSSGLLRPISTVTSVVVLLSIAFELWLWKLPFLHGWFVKRPVIDGTWKADLSSNWTDPATGASIPPVQGYMVVRQTFLSLSLRLLTEESSSYLVGTEIVCTVDGLYCVSGVYRNEPRYQERAHSPIHYGAVWLQVIDTPTRMLKGHYWTDRGTAGELTLSDKQRRKFQDYKTAEAFSAHPPTS